MLKIFFEMLSKMWNPMTFSKLFCGGTHPCARLRRLAPPRAGVLPTQMGTTHLIKQTICRPSQSVYS